tara:strand:- start:569 stop:892 length:324 start_codon:yes stop_codon:yes gene_type:complete
MAQNEAKIFLGRMLLKNNTYGEIFFKLEISGDEVNCSYYAGEKNFTAHSARVSREYANKMISYGVLPYTIVNETQRIPSSDGSFVDVGKIPKESEELFRRDLNARLR